LLAGLSAKANLIQASDPGFGANSLTVDTTSGLGWLDLTATAGLSYQQVLADTQPGGIYSGFRFATVQEVLNLYSDAGIAGTGYYSLATPSIESLISLLGAPELINGLPGFIALSASGSSSVKNAPAIYAIGVNGTEVYWVNGGGAGYGGGTAYGTAASYPELSSWLVSNVPESSGASVYVLAAASLIWCRCLLRAKMPAHTKPPEPTGGSVAVSR
jgi:hypothetical protein